MYPFTYMYMLRFLLKGEVEGHYFLFIDRVTQLRTSGLSRNTSMRRSCRTVDFVNNNNKDGGPGSGTAHAQSQSNVSTQNILVSEFKKAQLPLSIEALNSLTLLCFPGKIQQLLVVYLMYLLAFCL